MLNILQKAGDPFDDGVDEDILRAAEARARDIRKNEEVEEPVDISASSLDVPTPSAAAESAEAPDVNTGMPLGAPAGPPEGSPEKSDGAPSARAEVKPKLPGGLSSSVVGKSLESSTISYEPARKRFLMDALRVSPRIEGAIMNGDDPFPETVAVHGFDAEKAKRLGFPDRPQVWPQFMAWPPADFVRHFMAERTTEEQRRAMIARLAEIERKMLLRGKQIKAYLDEFNPREEQDRESRRVIDNATHDPYFGIKWATLINPGMQDQALVSSVLSWGHCTARTADGGSLRVHNDSITFSGSTHGQSPMTPQSMALAMREARNRGWGKVKMQGSYEFGMMAIKAAKEAGLEAEISYYGKGALSWKAYKVKVMPNAPLPDLPEMSDTPAPKEVPVTSPERLSEDVDIPDLKNRRKSEPGLNERNSPEDASPSI